MKLGIFFGHFGQCFIQFLMHLITLLPKFELFLNFFPFRHSIVVGSNPTGVRDFFPFSVSQCGPISFLGLSLRRYYLGYLLKYFNLVPYLNHYIMLVLVCEKSSLSKMGKVLTWF